MGPRRAPVHYQLFTGMHAAACKSLKRRRLHQPTPCPATHPGPHLSALQLMTPAAVLARTSGREAVSRGDVEEVHTLFRCGTFRFCLSNRALRACCCCLRLRGLD